MSMNLEKKQKSLQPSPPTVEKASMLQKILGWASIISVIIGLYLIFFYAPEEKMMGMVQKIFFVHVPIAWIGFGAFFVTFVFSILYLVKRKRIYDTYAYVSAEIGVVFITLVLITGMIWAKSSWNTWWAWEPRLTTSLILWFIYVAYVMIRQMDGVWEKKARLAAVFGIIGFVDVPIVFMAIRWWNTKFHPVVFGEGKDQSGGGIEPEMLVALLTMIAFTTILYSFLLVRGVSFEKMKIKVEQYKEQVRESIK
ncbi:cytochrome c biogenesis protein [Neobacillus sp. LXY-4]|uniref:cytochrome c biogenesis protein n=1 Tax=Neobacillus sp. LXY-4 TaxID=3379826 RepID=UPI003EE064D8